MAEHDIQSAYFDWARLDPVARRAYAIPNGGHRHIRVAQKLKREGTRAGVLDVHIPVPRATSPGLYIEFKAGYNKLTPEQQQEVEALLRDGFVVAVAWDAERAVNLTKRYLAGELMPGFYELPAAKPCRSRSR